MQDPLCQEDLGKRSAHFERNEVVSGELLTSSWRGHLQEHREARRLRLTTLTKLGTRSRLVCVSSVELVRGVAAVGAINEQPSSNTSWNPRFPGFMWHRIGLTAGDGQQNSNWDTLQNTAKMTMIEKIGELVGLEPTTSSLRTMRSPKNLNVACTWQPITVQNGPIQIGSPGVASQLSSLMRSD